MKKEEAIQYLIKPVSTSTEIGEEKQKEFEAHDIAIEALSAQTDYISRADAIKEIKECTQDAWTEDEANVNRGMEYAMSIIKALPSADAEYADLPDIPRYYYEKVVGKMAHEINMLKEQLESTNAVHIETYRKLYEKYVELKHAIQEENK